MVDNVNNNEIKKLSGDWKKWADEADSKGNKDSYINSAFEIEYVKNQARLADKTDEEISAIFGADFSSTNAITKVPTDNTGRERTKRMQDHVINNLVKNESKTFVENSKTQSNWNVFVDNIRNTIMSDAAKIGDDIEYYSRLIGEMETVAKALNNHKYNSRTEVNALYNTVKKELALDKNDKFREFKLDLLEKFVHIAEEHQISKEKTTVQNRYKELAKTMSREDALKEVKKQFSGKGSYIDDFNGYKVDDQIKLAKELETNGYADTSVESRPTYKGILSSLSKKFLMDEAEGQVTTAINAQRQAKKEEQLKLNPEVEKYLKDNGLYEEYMQAKTKSKDVKKDAITFLKAKGQYDKFAKKYLRGRTDMSFKEIITFEDSNVKSLNKSVGIENQVNINKAKNFTESEFTDVLKNKTVFEGLRGVGNAIKLEPPLITETGKDKNGNTTYNLSNLAGVIALHLGADLTANRQVAIFKPYSEVERTIVDISTKLGFEVSKQDIKNLIELCGFEFEGKNVVKIAYDTVAGAAVDALTGLAGILGLATNIKSNSVIDNAIVNYAGNKGPYTIGTDIAYQFIDKIIDENDLHVAINVTLNGLGTLNFDEDEMFMNSNLSWKNFDIQQTENTLSIVIDKKNTTTVELIRNLEDTIFKEVTPEELGIDWNKYELDLEHHAEMNKKDAIKNAVKSALLTALLLNAIKAILKEQPEVPVVVTNFENISIEEYWSRLDTMVSRKTITQKQADGFKALAAVFIEKDDNGNDVRDKDGNLVWNCDKYKNLLNRCAGDGSVFNKHEGYITFTRIDEIIEEVQSLNVKKIETNKTDKETVISAPIKRPEVLDDKLSEIKQSPDAKYAFRPDDRINVKYSGWAALHNLYDEKDFPKGGKPDVGTRMLKVMQGMQDTKLTVEQIRTLADLSFKISLKKMKNGQYDYNDFAQKAKQKFANLDFLKDYNFDYIQFAKTVCAAMPGDNKNELLAPKVLYHDDGTECVRADYDVDKFKVQVGKKASSVSDRGKAGQTVERAVQVNGNDVEFNVSESRLKTVQDIPGSQNRPELLNKSKTPKK